MKRYKYRKTITGRRKRVSSITGLTKSETKGLGLLIAAPVMLVVLCYKYLFMGLAWFFKNVIYRPIKALVTFIAQKIKAAIAKNKG